MLRTVAALYVLARGPYSRMEGVDPWPLRRDAQLYRGPHPVVTHPPCAFYTPFASQTTDLKAQDPTCAIRAVAQAREYGGVVEHPAGSRLWELMGIPPPPDFRQRSLWGPERDDFGGWTLRADLSSWGFPGGHKPTGLYLVGIDPEDVKIPPPAPKPKIPDHLVDRVEGWRPKPEKRPGRKPGARCAMDVLSPTARKRSPDAFAEWLVALARTAKRPGMNAKRPGRSRAFLVGDNAARQRIKRGL